MMILPPIKAGWNCRGDAARFLVQNGDIEDGWGCEA
jgi:hypothetical protein